jgi:hypothetical protein
MAEDQPPATVPKLPTGECSAAQGFMSETCAYLTPGSVRSQLLGANYHEACCDLAWAMKDLRQQNPEGLHVEVTSGPMGVHATGGEESP